MAQLRSDAWRVSAATSCGPLFRTRSDETLPKTIRVPAPLFNVTFTSAGSGLLRLPATVLRSPERLPRPLLDQPVIEPMEAAAAEPEPQPEPDAIAFPEAGAALEAPPGPGDPAHKANVNQIELIIDSLPRHQLSEPLPVTIESLGDQVFTATIPDLNLMTTGHSIGEALLVMKEQVETVYEDFNRRRDLSDEHLEMLKFLQRYIGRNARRAGWYPR